MLSNRSLFSRCLGATSRTIVRKPLGLLWVILATLSLTVPALAAPGWSLASADSTVSVGSSVELTYTILNSESVPVSDIVFSHTYPTGVALGHPGLAASNCDAIVSAPSGGSTLSVSNLRMGVGDNCFIKVHVVLSQAGEHTLTSESMSYLEAGVAGTLTAVSTVITVDASLATFGLSISPTSVVSGATTTLTIALENDTASLTQFGLAVDLPTGLTVATPSRASQDCYAGISFAPTPGGGSFSTSMYMVGNSSCTVTVELLVANPGIHAVRVSGTAGFSSTSVGTRQVEVSASTGFLTKLFKNEPVAPGQTATVSYTLTQFDRDHAASNIAFTDDFSTILPGATLTGLPLDDVCGAGSQLSGTSALQLTGATLAAEQSCTFEASLLLADSQASGDYLSTTSAPTATVNGSPVTHTAATDYLRVEPGPLLIQSATSAAAGGTTTVTYTLSNPSTTEEMTDISFTTDVTAVLPFPVTATLPSAGFCGDSATLSLAYLGEDQQGIQLTGGSLAALSSCTFDVEVGIPEGLSSAQLELVTGDVLATVSGSTVYGANASTPLILVGAPRFTKTWSQTVVNAGDSLTLTYAIHMPEEAGAAASQIAFTDDLDSALSGMAATNLPLTDACGAGSILSGTSQIELSGGNIGAGETCTFEVMVLVPAHTDYGTYTSTASGISAEVDGATVLGHAASAEFTIDPLIWSQTLSEAVVLPGGTVTANYSFQNQHPTETMNLVVLPLSIESALSLTTPNLPQSDVCGATLSWSNGLSLGVVTLAPLEICSFSVEYLIDAAQAAGEYAMSASGAYAIVGALNLPTGRASSSLWVANPVVLGQEIATEGVNPGDSLTISYTIASGETGSSASSMAFSHDLGAALSGWAATNTPLADICGVGSSVTGTDILEFTGGILGEGESCTFQIETAIPVAAEVGTVVSSTTSELSVQVSGAGLVAAGATDTFTVIGLNIDMAFNDTTTLGDSVELNVTLTNPSSSASLDGFSWSNDFGTTLTDLVSTSETQNEICGVGSSLSGSSIVGLSQASLGAGESCSFSLSLATPPMAIPGIFTHSSHAPTKDGLAVGPIASANLHLVAPVPQVSALVSPAILALPNEAVWVVTIDNTASPVSVNALGFSVTLPEFLQVGASGASTTCESALLDGAASASVVQLSQAVVSAISTCSVTIPISAQDSGEFELPSVALSTELGDAHSEPVTLRVDPPLTVLAQVTPAAIGPLGTTTLTVSLDNSQALQNATDAAFTVELPFGLSIAAEPQLVSSCGGTLSAEANATALALSGGFLEAGASCSVQVKMSAAAAGTYSLSVTNADSNLGLSLSASTALSVDPIPGFSMSASPAGIWFGQVTTLSYSVDNTLGQVDLGSLAFSHSLPTGVSIVGEATLSSDCNAAFTPVAPTDGATGLSVANAALGAGLSCTVSVDIRGDDAEQYNLEAALLDFGTGEVHSETVSFSAWSLPTLAKVFEPSQLGVGSVTTLTYSISNTSNLMAPLAVSFSETFATNLAIAQNPAPTTTCADAVFVAEPGASVFSFSGETVSGENCTVSVGLETMLPGSVTTLSEPLVSVVGETAGAAADLEIVAPPTLVAGISPEHTSLVAGAVLTLTFDNSTSPLAASAVALSFPLPTGLAVASAGASTTCSGGVLSAEVGGEQISYTAGVVPAATLCTLSVAIAAQQAGTYVIAIGDSQTSLGVTAGSSVTLGVDPAPSIAASLSPSALGPFGSTVLTVVVDNGLALLTASDITFEIVLPAGLLLADDPLAVTNCDGLFSAVSGSDVLSLTEAFLAPGATCEFSATLKATQAGTSVVAVGTWSSSLGGGTGPELALSVNPAPQVSTTVSPLTLWLGSVAQWNFTIDNNLGDAPIQDLVWTQALSAGFVVEGDALGGEGCTGELDTATEPPSDLVISGIGVSQNANCILLVEARAIVAGEHILEAGVLDYGTGEQVSHEATLSVSALPAFSQAFEPAVLGIGQVTRLTFTVDNTQGLLAASELAFSETFPVNLKVAAEPSVETTCEGGELNVTTGGDEIMFHSGMVGAGESCSVSVQLITVLPGTVNLLSEPLTSTAPTIEGVGVSLEILPAPDMVLSLSPQEIEAEVPTTLTLDVLNLGSRLDAENFLVTVIFPAQILPAAAGSEAMVVSECEMGEVTWAAETNSVKIPGLRIPARGQCAIDVAIVPQGPGTYQIETSPGQSSLGMSHPVSTELRVLPKQVDTVEPTPDDEDGGCACSGSGKNSSDLSLWMLFGVLAWMRRKMRTTALC